MKKISRFVTILVLAASFGLPLLVNANLVVAPTPGSVDQKYLQYYRDTIVWVVNSVLVPVLIAVAFIVFLWGVFNYFIYGADDEAKRKEGKQFVLWGIIGLVIIFSTWALVNIVSYTLFPSTVQNTAPTPPTL